MKQVLPDSPPKIDKILGVFPQPDWYKLSDGDWYHIVCTDGKIYFDGALIKDKQSPKTSKDFLLPDEIGEL